MQSLLRSDFIDNHGGIAEIELCPVHLVEETGKDILLGPSDLQVTFKEGGEWFKLEVIQESASLDIKSNIVAFGNSLNVNARGTYPLANYLATSVLSKWIEYELFILKMKDNNGNIRLLGNVEEPLKIDVQSKVPAKITERPGFQVSFSGNQRNEPPFIIL